MVSVKSKKVAYVFVLSSFNQVYMETIRKFIRKDPNRNSFFVLSSHYCSHAVRKIRSQGKHIVHSCMILFTLCVYIFIYCCTLLFFFYSATFGVFEPTKTTKVLHSVYKCMNFWECICVNGSFMFIWYFSFVFRFFNETHAALTHTHEHSSTIKGRNHYTCISYIRCEVGRG